MCLWESVVTAPACAQRRSRQRLYRRYRRCTRVVNCSAAPSRCCSPAQRAPRTLRARAAPRRRSQSALLRPSTSVPPAGRPLLLVRARSCQVEPPVALRAACSRVPSYEPPLCATEATVSPPQRAVVRATAPNEPGPSPGARWAWQLRRHPVQVTIQRRRARRSCRPCRWKACRWRWCAHSQRRTRGSHSPCARPATPMRPRTASCSRG